MTATPPDRRLLDQMTDPLLAELYEELDEVRQLHIDGAAENLRLRARLAKSEQGRRNLRGLLEHHRDMGFLGALRAAHNRLARALRACARYRAEMQQLRADCQRWADCAAAAEKTRRIHAADADQYEAQLRARIAELEAALDGPAQPAPQS